MASETNGVAIALWQRVEEERARRGWSQEELWRESGLPPSTINRLKDGKPRASTVKRLADALGIDPVEAARLAGTAPPAAAPPVPRPMTLREAVDAEPDYTAEERAAVHAMLDLIEAQHRARMAVLRGDERPTQTGRPDGEQRAI